MHACDTNPGGQRAPLPTRGVFEISTSCCDKIVKTHHAISDSGWRIHASDANAADQTSTTVELNTIISENPSRQDRGHKPAFFRIACPKLRVCACAAPSLPANSHPLSFPHLRHEADDRPNHTTHIGQTPIPTRMTYTSSSKPKAHPYTHTHTHTHTVATALLHGCTVVIPAHPRTTVVAPSAAQAARKVPIAARANKASQRSLAGLPPCACCCTTTTNYESKSKTP